jgi:NitT/TauT family transport system ATP-binding protein
VSAGTQPVAAAEPIVVMDRVTKVYGGKVVALQNMSLAIRPGEFVSFLGPSGCGKSTALKMIAGLIEPTAGAIRIAPSDAKGEHDLAFVFQEPTLMPWATVLDNVRLPLRLSGRPKDETVERARAALAEVGLSRFEKSYPRELSGGMKMRVSIARAMAARPRLLLMDEPFAALDEMTRGKLNDDVTRLAHQHGLTVIFVTHSVYEAVYLSTRVVVMAARPGRVADDLTLSAAWPRDESHRVTADYAEEARRVSEVLKGTLDAAHIDH